MPSNPIKGIHVLLPISMHWRFHLFEPFSFLGTDFPEHIVQLWFHFFVSDLGLWMSLYHFHLNIWELAKLLLLFLATFVDLFNFEHVFLVNLFGLIFIELDNVLLRLFLILDNKIAFFLFLMKGVGFAL